jgi:glutamate-5-semialdehyde dehydrogenase
MDIHTYRPQGLTPCHDERQTILGRLADRIEEESSQAAILEANSLDLDAARQAGVSGALYDRLRLSPDRLKGMAAGLRKVRELPDPLAAETSWQHSSGMIIRKQRVPIGLLLVVYEARPNVTTDSLGIAVKTGNHMILKGSRQTKATNEALASVLRPILQEHGIAEGYGFFTDMSHEASLDLLRSPDIDLVVPRGGERLKKLVLDNSHAPVLGAGGGICHAYVSEHADLEMAASIIHNAKTQRPSVCNALETVLVHESWLTEDSLRLLLGPLLSDGVKLYCDARVSPWLPEAHTAAPNTWDNEYLDMAASVRAVASLEEAVDHINRHGTGHSETIVTGDPEEGERFAAAVDSACLYVNASTRFTDGEEFGFGAEIGISTQKLHARGPLGPRELTSYKYVVTGSGQVRP